MEIRPASDFSSSGSIWFPAWSQNLARCRLDSRSHFKSARNNDTIVCIQISIAATLSLSVHKVVGVFGYLTFLEQLTTSKGPTEPAHTVPRPSAPSTPLARACAYLAAPPRADDSADSAERRRQCT